VDKPEQTAVAESHARLLELFDPDFPLAGVTYETSETAKRFFGG
jgi:hypothetical protein